MSTVRAYYNEIDPYAAQWLRNLIASGEIPEGEVDERSIAEVKPEDLVGFRQHHFFAGIGGWPLALRIAGWPDDKRVWTGSAPCQPFSSAGKRKGIADERHLWPEFRRLIAERRPATVFGEQVASPDGRAWLAGVRADLEALGYAVGAADLCAAGEKAPQLRQRLYWVAFAGCSPAWRDSQSRLDSQATPGVEVERREQAAVELAGCGAACGLGFSNGTGSQSRESTTEGARHGNPAEPASDVSRLEHAAAMRWTWSDRTSEQERGPWSRFVVVPLIDGTFRRAEPESFPLADGIPRDVGSRFPELRSMARSARANRVGRLRGYGNSIVPQVAAEFIRAYLATEET